MEEAVLSVAVPSHSTINVTSYKDPYENTTRETNHNIPFYVIDRLYIIVPVCVIGIIFNILNIAVLTRKSMRSSINILLTGLAFSDLTTIFFEVGVPMLIQAATPSDVPSTYSTYSLGIISFVDYYVAFWFANVSNWITVTVGSWRYVAVTWPLRAQMWCTSKRAKISIAIIIVACFIMSIPAALIYDMRLASTDFNASVVIYEMTYSSIVARNNNVLFLYQYVYAFMRIVPSIILVFVTCALIRSLLQAAAVRRKLQERGRNLPQQDYNNHVDRTTAMLLIIVAIFLISNLPYSILLLLDLSLGVDYYHQEHFEGAMDYFQVAVLINYSVNFLIYYLMCRKFQRTFVGFLCCAFTKMRSQTTSSTTTVETLAEENNFRLHNINGLSSSKTVPK